MVIYAILGYLIGFSIVVYWHFYKIENYLEDIINKLDKECRYSEEIIIPNEWKISPKEVEKMYNTAPAQIVIREYDKKRIK